VYGKVIGTYKKVMGAIGEVLKEVVDMFFRPKDALTPSAS
jgi:hypothetical protein